MPRYGGRFALVPDEPVVLIPTEIPVELVPVVVLTLLSAKSPPEPNATGVAAEPLLV
jgi:hypothetical protein